MGYPTRTSSVRVCHFATSAGRVSIRTADALSRIFPVQSRLGRLSWGMSGALSLRERYAGLLETALVADSLALAPHWIYDQDEIEEKFGRVTELLPPPPGSYHAGKERGAQTHYGDQTLVLMESIEACGGNFVMEDFARRWREFWRTSNAYCDHATRETIAHLDAGRGLTQVGSRSMELGGAIRIAPLLLALRGEETPTIIGAVRAQTAFTHASPIALDAAEFLARTVFLLMRGVSIPTALRTTADLPYKSLPASEYLRRAENVAKLPISDAVESLGSSCPLEKALPSVFAILLSHGDDPETALVENVMAGGNSASRGMALGILLGAAHGRNAVPKRWSDNLLARKRINSFIATVGLGDVTI
jgi:ADP-ribosylglycohydrolase